MILSDPAIYAMEDIGRSFLKRVTGLFRIPRLVHVPGLSAAAIPGDEESAGVLPVELASIIDLQSFRLGGLRPNDPGTIQRRARAIALRGLTQARDGDFAAAHASFVEAVTLDGQLALVKLPDFLKLPREAHVAAIAAYEDAGQPAMAAALTAIIRSNFKPRLLPNPGSEQRSSAVQ